MNAVVILTTCLGLLVGCKRQPSDLNAVADQTTSITVYDLEGLAGPKYSKQDLDNAFRASLAPELFRDLAPEAKFKDEWVLWKGSRLAVARLKDGTEKQLALSYYGAFFKILGEDGFFYFEGEARAKWEEAFYKAIIQDDFIPKRIARDKQPLETAVSAGHGPQ
ncbi:MAG: hypothetical protein ACOX9C_02740 [Kiritimatiellia bacterium]